MNQPSGAPDLGKRERSTVNTAKKMFWMQCRAATRIRTPDFDWYATISRVLALVVAIALTWRMPDPWGFMLFFPIMFAVWLTCRISYFLSVAPRVIRYWRDVSERTREAFQAQEAANARNGVDQPDPNAGYVDPYHE
jgi:hypothetical protein